MDSSLSFIPEYEPVDLDQNYTAKDQIINNLREGMLAFVDHIKLQRKEIFYLMEENEKLRKEVDALKGTNSYEQQKANDDDKGDKADDDQDGKYDDDNADYKDATPPAPCAESTAR
ncbi:hypothetical protein E3N88_39782 [Mikania micrantha]|uniref:Uncharacterized protein n=1 Tax=Mikania micrantha TaxID=192012 RepID=A0A5N6LKS1_9ASTR|nr:hypothetical protein E3N88_39782 [Mikania micrantha]